MLGFMQQRRRRMLKDRAQQVVLAVATFDPQGRLLVNQSGLMPCQTITRQFHQRVSPDRIDTCAVADIDRPSTLNFAHRILCSNGSFEFRGIGPG
jgi:hypothetical protein